MSGRILSIGFKLRRIGYFRCDFSTGKQSLNHVERYRDKKNRDARSGDHSADHGRAEHATRDSARTAGEPKRQTAEDESEGRHENRTEAQSRAIERGVAQGFTFLVLSLGELDADDPVLV